MLDCMYIRTVETQVNNIYTQKWAYLFFSQGISVQGYIKYSQELSWVWILLFLL